MEKGFTYWLRTSLLITPFVWLFFSMLFNIWSWNGFIQVLIMNVVWFAWTLDVKRLEVTDK